MATLRKRLTAKLAILIFVASFGLYATTMSEFHGYEVMTSTVTDNIVRHGSPRISKDNAFYYTPRWNRGKGYYAATGIVQPMLQVPFFVGGMLIDDALNGGKTYRVFFTRLYTPFIAALSVVCIFFLTLWTRRSIRWAIALSVLFAVGSLAWPYSKIGMETTLMLALLVTFLAALKASRSTDYRLWLLTGLLIGLSAGTKPYGLLSALGVFPLLLPLLKKSDSRTRRQLLISLGTPILAMLLVILWYNQYRTGSIFDAGYPSPPYSWASIFNLIGSIVSPGKGLIWYSPLVILGALGIKQLWSKQRTLAMSLLSVFVLGAIPAASGWWGDEGWGPRYLVPVAWTLLIPLAWWVTSIKRKRILLAITALAIFSQILGVVFRYDQYFIAARSGSLTGTKIYSTRAKQKIYPPFGWDSVRWIPEVSPLLFNAEALYSKIHRLAGRGDRTVYYAPFGGQVGSYNFSRTSFPDFWWIDPSDRLTEVKVPSHTVFNNPSSWWAMLFFFSFLAGSYGVFRLIPSAANRTSKRKVS